MPNSVAVVVATTKNVQKTKTKKVSYIEAMQIRQQQIMMEAMRSQLGF